MKKGRQQEKPLMERIDKRDAEALNWLRYVLNPDTTMPTVSDWSALMAFAEKQALTGIFLPEKCPENLSKVLLLQWIGLVQLIEQRNKLLNKRVELLFGMLGKDGFHCCLLKGQGNAEMYPDPSVRMPGDVDLWIDAEEKAVRDFVTMQFPDAKDCYKHIKFPVFDDVEVDVHQTPLKFRRPLHRKRLQRWIKLHQEEQFLNKTQLRGTEGYISVPTAKFNAIYQLGHIMIHLFDEGIGFRHLIDYYYVLRNLSNVSQGEREEIVRTWKKLGLLRLASAVTWIESEKLGLSENCLLTSPNRRLGTILLSDVIEGGNFGHYSIRQQYRRRGKRLARRFSSLMRLLKLSPCFPTEAVYWIMGRCVALIKHDFGYLKGKLSFLTSLNNFSLFSSTHKRLAF